MVGREKLSEKIQMISAALIKDVCLPFVNIQVHRKPVHTTSSQGGLG